MSDEKKIPENIINELEIASQKYKEGGDEEPYTPSETSLKVVYSQTGSEKPFEEPPAAITKGAKAYSGDYWGTFSLEKFASAGSLRYTHEDAWGWLSYLEKFHPRNFRYLDKNVRIWAYYENYDNWQDTYGMDAVLAVYHSGHGGMTNDGKFLVPLGSDWGGLGTTAWSDKMRLGNEQVRYIFWSTCFSCRVFGGHSPIRTWSPANLGFRMLFGYETVSYDDPDYGKAFWKHWNKGKSFSTAFMDASWYDVSHRQAPTVVACGATKQEAVDRVFKERYFNWGAVSRNWWWWRWYNAASSATAARAVNQNLPKELLVAELKPVQVDGNYVRNLFALYDFGIGLPREVMAGPNGIFNIREGDQRIAIEGDGTYEIQFANPNRENTDQLSLNTATNIASDFLRRHGLDIDGIVLDRVKLSCEAGGSIEGSGQIEGPYVTETVVQFAQVINGLPVLLPGKGGISVSIDNDGTVTCVRNFSRGIANLTDQLKSSPMAPDEEGPSKTGLDPKRLLADAWQENMKDWLIRGRMPIQNRVVPGTYEIGYALKGNQAILVARNDIEIDCGSGYLKRYSIEVPLVE